MKSIRALMVNQLAQLNSSVNKRETRYPKIKNIHEDGD